MKTEGGLDFRYFYPEVLQVVPVDDYVVYAYMNDGSIKKIDMKEKIAEGEVFSRIRDREVFRSQCTVIGYTVAWMQDGSRDPDKCLDLDPFFIFRCPSVKEEEVLAAVDESKKTPYCE